MIALSCYMCKRTHPITSNRNPTQRHKQIRTSKLNIRPGWIQKCKLHCQAFGFPSWLSSFSVMIFLHDHLWQLQTNNLPAEKRGCPIPKFQQVLKS